MHYIGTDCNPELNVKNSKVGEDSIISSQQLVEVLRLMIKYVCAQHNPKTTLQIVDKYNFVF